MMAEDKTELILASASPRRREIMQYLDRDYIVVPSECDETVAEGLSPEEVVRTLSLRKAEDVYRRVTDGTGRKTVIGSDTVVCVKNVILGKPHDRDDAKRMLRLLSGDTHEVYTGVTVISGLGEADADTGTFSDVTRVTVSEMSDTEIEDYILREQPYDKAGSYAIQGSFALYLESIEGSYHNVVGFPIEKVYHYLKGKGLL